MVKRGRSESSDESDSDREVRAPKRKRAKTNAKRRARSESECDSDSCDSDYESDSDSDSSDASGGSKVRVKAKESGTGWKWWKEARRADGVKWNFLEHNGPVFAADYERLPKDVNFRYNRKPLRLSKDAEEVAGFYARLIRTVNGYPARTRTVFNENFFKDWRSAMTSKERGTITDLRKCDFEEISDYFNELAEERRRLSKEERLELKEENEAVSEKYGTCTLDGHEERIGNFRIEPPGLFLGRGQHPLMGCLKRRVRPEDVIVNCAKNSRFPKPPKGHKWKEVRHDNTVSWLACWTENIQEKPKYVMLNPSSRLKGEKDLSKYDKARELGKRIERIREKYKKDLKSKEMRIQQRAVAIYFIDQLALRAGNEKGEDQADTVGCCSLRYEHVKLADRKSGKQNVVILDFLGKDSIRYHNEVPIQKQVYRNLKLFLQNKRSGDALFDRLNTTTLNQHLSSLMDGLSAKVFRTYNASHTLEKQLRELTPRNGTLAEKMLAYNRANRKVAILCNHQRAVPKSHDRAMENLEAKIRDKKDSVKRAEGDLKRLDKGSKKYESKEKALDRLEDQLAKLEMNKTDREEGKDIALGTSKLNYLDPRITVAWCKKHDVPIEKVYNKTQRAKFRWASDMASKSFRFD